MWQKKRRQWGKKDARCRNKGNGGNKDGIQLFLKIFLAKSARQKSKKREFCLPFFSFFCRKMRQSDVTSFFFSFPYLSTHA